MDLSLINILNESIVRRSTDFIFQNILHLNFEIPLYMLTCSPNINLFSMDLDLILILWNIAPRNPSFYISGQDSVDFRFQMVCLFIHASQLK